MVKKKYAEAEQLLADVLDRFRRSGNDSLPRGNPRCDGILAVIYLDQKKNTNREKMLNGVVETLKTKRGAERPAGFCTHSRYPIALYFSQGQHDVAIARF